MSLALAAAAAGTLLAGPVAGAPAIPRVAPDGPLAVAPDGGVWFASAGLTRVSPDGLAATFPLPGVGQVHYIAADARGDIWFGEFGGRVGRLTPAGVLTLYPRGAPRNDCGECDADHIAVAPGGGVWMAGGAVGLGRVSPEGVYSIIWSAIGSQAGDITAGPDGAMWVTLPQSGLIGRVSPIGEVATFGAGRGLAPSAIVAGPDGALWFTEPERERVGRITTDGTITTLATPGLAPERIVAGADGRLWFSTRADDGIGRITTGGVVDVVPVPPAIGIYGRGLAAAPDGGVWVTLGAGRSLGRISPEGVLRRFPPAARVTSRRSIGARALRVGVRCPSGAAIDCRVALRLRLRRTGRLIGSARFAVLPPGGLAQIEMPVPVRWRTAASRGALGASLTPLLHPGVAFGEDRGVPVDPGQDPQGVIGLSGLGPVARQGEELFLSSGCTSCHRIKGVGAPGPGPELTRQGRERRSPESYRRLLRDPPGGIMPAFQAFTAVQYRRIGVFLSGLGTRYR